MTRASRLIPVMAALTALAAPAPAAAQDAPAPVEEVVARVGEQPVLASEFDRWLESAARSQYGAVLEPPRFERCVAAQLRRAPKGKPKPTRRALRKRCRGGYAPLRRQVMRFLVQALWVTQEAAAQGVLVSPARVRRAFERQKRAAFNSEREYRRFLRESGSSEADILYRVELEILQSRLSAKFVASAPAVTEQDVDRYYARHRARYRGVPRAKARRSIRRRITFDRQQRALLEAIEDFRRRYVSVTACAEGYVIEECGAGPIT